MKINLFNTNSIKFTGAFSGSNKEDETIFFTDKKEQDFFSSVTSPIFGYNSFNLSKKISDKEKEKIMQMLISAKKNLYPRFSKKEIDLILEGLSSENINLLETFLNEKKPDKSYRFDGYQIADILNVVNIENTNAINRLLSSKDRDKFRFDAYYIKKILPKINSENITALDLLLNQKQKDGTFRFEGNDFINILGEVTSANEFGLKILLNEKDGDRYRFDSYNIGVILSELDKEKEDSLKLMLSDKKDNSYRFQNEEIRLLLSVLTPENKHLLKKLMPIVTEDGEYRFDSYSMSNIIKNCTQEKEHILDKLIKISEKKNSQHLTDYFINDIIQYVTPDTENHLWTLFSTKNEDNKYRFEATNIIEILSVLNKENGRFLNYLLSKSYDEKYFRFDHLQIKHILKSINKSNIDKLFKLISQKKTEDIYRFNGFEIGQIMKSINEKNSNIFDKFIKIDELGENQLSKDSLIYVLKQDTETAEKIYDFYRNKKINIASNYVILFLNNDFSKINFKNRLEILDVLSKEIPKITDENLKKSLIFSQKTLQKSIEKSIDAIPISQQENIIFWKNFLVSADRNNEVIIKNLTEQLQNYNKTGLPLKYSRKRFLEDLKKELSKISKEKQEEILDKLDIEFKENDYDGFLNIEELDNKNIAENNIKEICKKFLLQNEILTEDQKTNVFLNSIIKAIPEFMNIIGRIQHEQHDFCLDIHILYVLSNVVNNPKFQELSNTDKMIAQMVALLHDIGKKSNEVDKNHEFMSAIISNDILNKFNISMNIKKRIIENIKNHNWLEQVNMNNMSAREAALHFRNSEDIKIAEIIAEADLKSINQRFYKMFVPTLSPAIDIIKNEITDFYSSGNVIFNTKITDLNKIPTMRYERKIIQKNPSGTLFREKKKTYELKVLDINKFSDSQDFRELGLSVKDKKDIRILFHTGDFEVMKNLTKPFNNSIICASIISPNKKATYNGSKIGMLLDTVNVNVINSNVENQVSGRTRDFSSFVEMSSEKIYRFFQQKLFLSKLYAKYSIKADKYAEIYKELSKKNYITQIEDITLSDGTVIEKEDLISAYKHMEDIMMKNADKKHNEINIYNPTLKGAIIIGKSLDGISTEILDFLEKENLPIIMM